MLTEHEAHDHAKRRRSRDPWRLSVWALGSWLIATLLFCVWAEPITVGDAGDPTFTFGKLAVCAVSGGFLYVIAFGALAEAHGDLTRRRLIIISALAPVALLIAGGALYNRHIQYRRGLDAFDAYTGRFPRYALGDPYVLSDRHSVVVVCARQVRTEDTHFCVESVTQPKYMHKGKYVIDGSFRYRVQDQDPDAPSGLILSPFDCSGEPVDCPPKE